MRDMQNREEWNRFVMAHGPRSGAFLQSWEWGQFQESLGRKIARIGSSGEEGESVEMMAMMIDTPLAARQRYLYVPRGPVTTSHAIDTKMLVKHLSGIAKDKGAMFLRFDAPIESATPIVWHHVEHTIAIQPPDTLILDLSLTEEQLLAAMHQKTRYNIRLAEKKGVVVDTTEATFDEVWAIFKETSHRGAFHLHPRSYYEAMLKSLNGPDCRAFLAVARYQGKAIAANVMIDFAGTRTYLHGASSDESRNVMAPFALHWALIQDAKEKGLARYDWWGVSPADDPAHPWAGVTRFKLGWGGERVSYPGTFDVVVKPAAYRMYQTARSVLRRMR